MHYDVVIVGGGAAGLMCAIEAAKRGRRTLVIEHNAEVGRKIIISGGGRCNFTNVNTAPENFISQNPHFVKSALARYTPQDFVSLVKKHRVEFYEKKLGQLFCSGSSRQIVGMLLDECRQSGVNIRTGGQVNSVVCDEVFRLETSQGFISARKLVIATGGLSFRKIGASDFGYRIAEQFGLSITSTRPSLVALVFAGRKNHASLAGVSVPAEVSCNGQRFRENILFTHRGLSGPAILQISNYWKPHETVNVNFLAEMDAEEIFETARRSKKTTVNFFGQYFPARFVEAVISSKIQNKPVAQLAKQEKEALQSDLLCWQTEFADTEGYDRAEVTLGGVSTVEISSQTMESKRVSGLYFVGEVVDVTGWLGGYNFQWAWASGYVAGNAV
jgi:predicted Rossmann fold flavoprotein